MKYLFIAIAAALLLAGYLTARWMPDAQSEVPTIYWVTDANPARQEQVKLFHQWLVDNGHFESRTLEDEAAAASFFSRNSSPKIRRILREVNPDHPALFDWVTDRNVSVSFPVTIKVPLTQLELDMANSDRTKKVIQGVSKVAGDTQDMDSGSDLRYYRDIGLNTDVTDDARRLGFDLSNTYPAIEDELALRDSDGNLRQYQFPANVNASLFFVNLGTFRQHGVQPPPVNWSIEEFERIGQEFVNKANEGLSKQKVFFATGYDFETLRRTFGGSQFNETTTAPTINEEATIKANKLLYKWTYGSGWRLLPNSADRSAFTTDSGYGGADAQLFSSDDRNKGQFGMFLIGRYILIQLREINLSRAAAGKPPLEMKVVNPPSAIFPNTNIGTRAVMLYSQSRHKELATLFLAFLASKEYNDQIVKDGDALPPNPKFTKTEAFNRPPDYPEEWAVHEPFATAALEIAVGKSYSPFIQSVTVYRIENSWRDKYMNDLISVEEAVRGANAEIEYEIQRKLEEDALRETPVLNPLYHKLLANQKKIDELKQLIEADLAAGRPIAEEHKIPVHLIENAFHKAYYAYIGWLKVAPTTQPAIGSAN